MQVLLGPLYDYLDGRLLGHSLRRNEKTRIAMKDQRMAEGSLYKGWQVNKTVTAIFGGQLCLMILASWAVRYHMFWQSCERLWLISS